VKSRNERESATSCEISSNCHDSTGKRMERIRSRKERPTSRPAATRAAAVRGSGEGVTFRRASIGA
jgi:hypothetical protein